MRLACPLILFIILGLCSKLSESIKDNSSSTSHKVIHSPARQKKVLNISRITTPKPRVRTTSSRLRIKIPWLTTKRVRITHRNPKTSPAWDEITTTPFPHKDTTRHTNHTFNMTSHDVHNSNRTATTKSNKTDNFRNHTHTNQEWVTTSRNLSSLRPHHIETNSSRGTERPIGFDVPTRGRNTSLEKVSQHPLGIVPPRPTTAVWRPPGHITNSTHGGLNAHADNQTTSQVNQGGPIYTGGQYQPWQEHRPTFHHYNPGQNQLGNQFNQHPGNYQPGGTTFMNNNDYHYIHTSTDTDKTELGFFLGYQLGKLTRENNHDTAAPISNPQRYIVHHYYHGNNNLPKDSGIESHATVSCSSDISVCPSGTMAICMNNGTIMCITSIFLTKPCPNDNQRRCVETSLPCINRNITGCQDETNTLTMPCISTVRINGNIEIRNNSIVVTSGADSQSLCITIIAEPLKVPERYRYTTNDTGITPIGFYLEQQLDDLTNASYNFLNYNGNNTSTNQHDHYNIYHYYKGNGFLPQEVGITPQLVISCLGDSGSFCPKNTTSLCLKDGAIACISKNTNTNLCIETGNTNCIYTTILCQESKSPACKEATLEYITTAMPCISTVTIYGTVSYKSSSFNGKNYTELVINAVESIEIEENITTTPEPMKMSNYCVTILAVPALKTNQTKIVRRLEKYENPYPRLPEYTYTTTETSSSTLGLYLKQKLDKLTKPSYYYLNSLYYDEGIIHKYDHYSLHTFYHGREVLPTHMDIYAESIIPCLGDSGTICPKYTLTLCLKDGTVMCVTDMLITENCNKSGVTNCAQTRVAYCSFKCKDKSKTMNVTLPCISRAVVHGLVEKVDNKLVVNKNQIKHYTDLQVIGVVSEESYVRKQMFCVSIVLIPAERHANVGETVFNNTKNIFGQFIVNALGLSK